MLLFCSQSTDVKHFVCETVIMVKPLRNGLQPSAYAYLSVIVVLADVVGAAVVVRWPTES